MRRSFEDFGREEMSCRGRLQTNHEAQEVSHQQQIRRLGIPSRERNARSLRQRNLEE